MATVYERQDSRFIWARIKGAPRQSTGISKKGRTKTETKQLWRDAQAWADEAEKSLRVEGPPFTVEQAVAEARAEQEFHKRAASTLDRGRVSGAHIGRILDWDTDLHRVERPSKLMESYVQTRRHEGATDHTTSKEVNFFLMGLRRAKREGDFRSEPNAFKVGALRGCYKPRTRWLPPDELTLLLDAARASAARYPWCVDRTEWILAFYFTGARHRELHDIRRQDVDLDRREVHLRGTKNEGAKRKVPIFDDLVPVLERRLALGGHYLFRPEWQRGRANYNLKKWCEAAGIDRCSPNDFRRSFATLCAERGISETLTIKFMGHKSSKMVREVYQQVSDRMRANAIEQFGSVLNERAENVRDQPTPIEKAREYRTLEKLTNA